MQRVRVEVGVQAVENPGGSAKLEVFRVQLCEVGPRMLFLTGAPSAVVL